MQIGIIHAQVIIVNNDQVNCFLFNEGIDLPSCSSGRSACEAWFWRQRRYSYRNCKRQELSIMVLN